LTVEVAEEVIKINDCISSGILSNMHHVRVRRACSFERNVSNDV
jgi:hypothetical protein